MNQILYKGEIFGGVGEDVTNKQYDDVTIHNPITDQDETYTPIGGENAEIFNCYKDEIKSQIERAKRNIATTPYTTVIGNKNKDLPHENPAMKDEGCNFICGYNNINIGEFNFITGENNFSKGYRNAVFGSDNATVGYENVLFGSLNKIYKTDMEVFRNMVNGINIKVTGYQNLANGGIHNIHGIYMFVTGQGNIVDYAAYSSILGEGNQMTGQNGTYNGSCIIGSNNKMQGGSATIILGKRNEDNGSLNGAVITGCDNLTKNCYSSLIYGLENNFNACQDGFYGGDNIKINGNGKSDIVGGTQLTFNNTGHSIICGWNSKAESIDHSIFECINSTLGKTYSSLILGKNLYHTEKIFNSLILGEEDKFLKPVKNNYLGTTFTRIDLYYTEPRITLYHKKDTPVTWTLGEQFDIVQHTYTADYGIVYYGYDSGRDIIVYKWNNDLNEWIIPENIENQPILGFVNESLLGQSKTEIEVYETEDSIVTVEEGQEVDFYQDKRIYRGRYTYYSGEWILSAIVPNRENVNVTYNIRNSTVLGSNNTFNYETRDIQYQTCFNVEEGEIDSISLPQIISTIVNDVHWQQGNSHVEPSGSSDGIFSDNDAFWALKIAKNNEGRSNENDLILTSSLFYWDNTDRKWKLPDYNSSQGWINPETHVPVNIIGPTLTDIGNSQSTFYSVQTCRINNRSMTLAELSSMYGTLQKINQEYQKQDSYEIRDNQLIKLTMDMKNSFVLGNNNTVNYNRTNLKILSSNTKVLNCYNANIIGDNNEFRNSENLVNLGQSNLYIGCKDIFNLGNDNSITSITSSLILGDNNNYIGGKNNIIIGFDGETDSDFGGISDSTIIGNNTTNNGGINHMVAIGEDNNLGAGAYFSYLFGYSNTFGGGINNSYIIGKSNIIESGSQDSFVLGQNNTATAGAGTSFILGLNNIARNGSNKNFIIGYNNIVTDGRNSSISIGNNLYNIFSNGILLGRYNSYPNAPVTSKLLILGNGYVDNQDVIHRSNCLEINEDGSQEIILQDKTLTSTLGIGKIEITQEKIKFTSLKDNSNNEKEIVEFTFEDLQSLKNIALAQNINNTPFPQI